MDEGLKLVEIVAHLADGDQWWQSASVFAIVVGVAIFVMTVALTYAVRLLTMILDLVKSEDNIPPKDYTPQVYMDVDISEQLRLIKHDLRADRVAVYQFRNGAKSIANNPFLKMMPTHESLSLDSCSVLLGPDNHGIMASVLGPWGKQLFDDKPIRCEDINKLACDSTMRPMTQYLRYFHAKSIYLYPMKRLDGKVFGFGVVEYCTQRHNLAEDFHLQTAERFLMIGGSLTGGKKING